MDRMLFCFNLACRRCRVVPRILPVFSQDWKHFQSAQNLWMASSSSRAETVMNVFDRKNKAIQRDRAAIRSDVADYDYLRKEIGYRVADRIKDVSRKFDKALEIGCGRGFVAPHLYSDMVGELHTMEISEKALENSQGSPEVSITKLHSDEENQLPFEQDSLDLVYSSMNLHWVNNLPGLFRNVLETLKPDGCFIGAMMGGESLFELRCSLQLAETEREGGFSPHISPFTSNRDLGNLLGRAGFNLLTIDVDEIVISYPSIFELMWDLKGMGENNAAWTRKMLHRDSLVAAASIYKELYGNADGTVPATYQILFMIGWKPHQSQAAPAPRGSGNFSLKDIDKLGLKTKKMGKVELDE